MANTWLDSALDTVARNMRAAGRKPVGYRTDGRAIWPIIGGSEPPAPAPAPAPPAPENGFPAGTPLEQMTDAQQAAYWRFYARKHEDTVKTQQANYQALKDKADQYDALLATTQTDQERAVEAAKVEGRNAARAETTPALVRSDIKVAAVLAGMTDKAALTALTDRLDTSTFLNDKGEVDPEEVEKYVKTIVTAPAPQHVPLGQGRTPTDAKPSVAAGHELFARTHGKTAATA